MQPIVKLVDGATAAVTDSIALSQTLAGAEPVTLNGALVTGNVAYLNPPELISITSDGDESGIFFTVVGKDQYGNSITELIGGPNTETSESVYAYSEVISITSDGATAGNITVGNFGVTYSNMIALEPYASPSTIYQVSVLDGSSMTWTIEGTLDNPNDPVYPCSFADIEWIVSPIATLVSEAVTQQAQSDWTPLFVRLKIAGTGQARFTIVQLGAVPK